jgi:invasion protein IalB
MTMMGSGSLARYAAVALLSVLVGGLLGWFGHDFAPMPSNVMTTAFFDDWRVICPALRQADPSCQLRQDLLNAKSRAEVAHLVIANGAGGTVLTATLPYDVLIQPGVGLSLNGGKVQVFPFQTCDSTGCVARIPADEELRGALRAAKQGRLLFAGLDKKVIALPFSLRGFSEAEAAFAAGARRRP